MAAFLELKEGIEEVLASPQSEKQQKKYLLYDLGGVEDLQKDLAAPKEVEPEKASAKTEGEEEPGNTLSTPELEEEPEDASLNSLKINNRRIWMNQVLILIQRRLNQKLQPLLNVRRNQKKMIQMFNLRRKNWRIPVNWYMWRGYKKPQPFPTGRKNQKMM